MRMLISLALLALLCGCGGQINLDGLPKQGTVITCQIGEHVVVDGRRAYCQETEGK